MTDFTAGYLPPGVYIDGVSSGSVAAVGVGATVVCLIGNGLGYEINTENVSFATTNAVALSKGGVFDDANLVISAVLNSGPTTFTKDVGPTQHDYSVSTSGGVTTITRHNSGIIPTDRPVKIVYRYADDAYFALNRFDQTTLLTSIYGAPLDPVTGAIASPLSFAAQQAFRNGANLVYVLALDLRAAVTPGSPTDSEVQAAFVAAYAKLIPNYEINLVVPLWERADDTASTQGYIADLVAFLGNSEAEGFPMMALAGVAASYATSNPDALATSADSRRLVLVWPNKLYYFNSQKNRGTTECDGFYAAAACAGVLADQPIARGLTRSQIVGFTGIPADVLNTMTTSAKNTWSSKGVSVIEINRVNQLVVRHGVTTDPSTIGTQEISIVRCQDAVLESLQLTLEGADLIGDPITVNTELMVASLVTGALEGLRSDDVIASYKDLAATQAPGPDNNPTVIKVVFSYAPTYPLNYISVMFTLDLTTNTLTNATDLTDTSNNSAI